MILLASLRSDEWTAWSEHVDDFIGPRKIQLLSQANVTATPTPVSHPQGQIAQTLDAHVNRALIVAAITLAILGIAATILYYLEVAKMKNTGDETETAIRDSQRISINMPTDLLTAIACSYYFAAAISRSHSSYSVCDSVHPTCLFRLRAVVSKRAVAKIDNKALLAVSVLRSVWSMVRFLEHGTEFPLTLHGSAL